MEDKKMYYDYARAIKERVINEVNGFVVTETYPELNAIIVKVTFKEYEYRYAIDDVSNKIYNSSSDLIISDFKEKYKGSIMKSFFKSNERKQRDKLSELGL